MLSCKEEGIPSQKSYEKEVKFQYDQDNHILAFNSVKELQETYEELKETEDSGEIFNKFYNQGFLPLRAAGFLSEKQIKSIQSKKRERMARRDARTFPNEGLIISDSFANLLNEEGEIEVGDKVYKYTEKGVFFVDKQFRHLLKGYPLSENNRTAINREVENYVPDRSKLVDFKVSEGSECAEETPDLTKEVSYYACGPSSNSVFTPNEPDDTSNYTVCVNSKDGFLDNIFGKSFACEYYFNSEKKLRTVFASEDFYFFTDVYAQAKFKNKTWLGWFSDRSANHIYLKNKKVILKVKERVFELPIFWTEEKEVKKVFNKITEFFTRKPNSNIRYISNVYDIDNNTTEVYEPTFEELIRAGNHDYVLTPGKKKRKPFIDIDVSLKNLFGQKVNKAIVLNVMGNNVLSYSNQQLLKMAADALKTNVFKLDKGQTGGIAFIGQDPNSQKIVPLAYSVFGETIRVQNLAIARRDFDIPSNTKLDKLVIGFSSDGNSRSYGIGFTIKWNVVNSVDIEIESGANYQGAWGGSKFKVQY